MKKLSNTEAELKKTFVIKEKRVTEFICTVAVTLRFACVCAEVISCVATTFYRQFYIQDDFIKCSSSESMLFRSSTNNCRFMLSNAFVISSRRRWLVSFLAEIVRSITILVANTCSAVDLCFQNAA